MVPTYFDNVFSYSGDNKSLQGFLDAIVLVMETGFTVTAFVCMILNLTLEEEIEETDAKLIAADVPVGAKEEHDTHPDGQSFDGASARAKQV